MDIGSIACRTCGGILSCTCAETIERYRAALRQIADSGNSINAHLARSVLEDQPRINLASDSANSA
jgi:hypothetical protein